MSNSLTASDSERLSDHLYSEYATQQQLIDYVNKHREHITSLTLTSEEFEETETLDFVPLGILPNLKSLELDSITVSSIVLTSANTPKLETLNLFGISSTHEHGLRFELELPELRSLSVQHVIVTGACDFGLSLTRCPNIREVTTYKFRYLSGPNFCVLPNCKRMTLHRSECTDSLEILQAPRLKELSVQAAYSLKNLRLWDMPYKLDVSDVEKLVKEYEACATRIANDLKAITEKWKNGTYGGKKAYKLGWIEREDINGFDFEKDEDVQLFLQEELDIKFEKRFKNMKRFLWEEFVDELSKRGVVHSGEKACDCTVNHVNMELDQMSLSHLRANPRVTLEGNDDELF